MADLERISDDKDCRFVDLYVRKSNSQAFSFYKKLGYYIHEEIVDYYTSLDNPNDTENAYDMHKLLHKWHKLDELVDKEKKIVDRDKNGPESSKTVIDQADISAAFEGVEKEIEDNAATTPAGDGNTPKTGKKKKKKNKKKK